MRQYIVLNTVKYPVAGSSKGSRTHPPQTAAGRQPPTSGNSSMPSPVPESVERLPGLMARAADLLLVLAHADTVVKVPSPPPPSHCTHIHAWWYIHAW